MRLTAEHSAPGSNIQDRIMAHLVGAGATTVLDAGCGDGALAAAAAATPLSVIGLDAAAPMARAARRR